MDDQIFNAVESFGIEKIKSILGCWEMAVHAIGNKSLGIVYMGGCFPGIVGKLNFMAGSTKLRSGSPCHGIVGDTEYGEGDDNSDNN